MTTLTKSLLLGATAMFCTSIAFANPKADTNNDGEISRAELMAEADAKFKAGDANFDGELTKAELDAAREAALEAGKDKAFDRADKNGDGSITRDEIAAQGDRGRGGENLREKIGDKVKDKVKDRVKSNVDTNSDGTIDETEKAAAKVKLDDLREGRKDSDADLSLIHI